MTTPYTVLALAFLLVASLASAQNVDPALRPPKGAQVALVVFEDLQCPDCRRAAPLVEEAARTYKIPVSATTSRCPCTTGRTMRP